jgi:hypothetical protein
VVSPELGIPRIEDRRYDVVISFRIAALAMHIYASNRVASRWTGNAQVPTFHVCIETDN